MTKRKALAIRRSVFLSFILPAAMFAHSTGPDPGLSGVPNEAGTCANCHASGASSINTKGGRVTLTLPNGNTYVPGQVQQWIVTVADPSAKRWGFQATARQTASTSTPAGGFTSSDSFTQTICSNSTFNGSQQASAGACPASTPLMYVEHTLAGTRLGTTGSVTFAFNWTPPATDAGPVTVYIAALAANGNNDDDPGDHVYTATYSLTASTASANAPAISANGVVNGASFTNTIEAGSWVTIQGSNFTSVASCDPVNSPQPGCRTWTASDFTNGTPTSLDGVSVSMGGKAAYVYYISPTQINVQAPDVGTGTVGVTVTSANGTSNSVTATADSYSPAFFLAGIYAIATHQDGTLVAPSSVIPGASPAKPGETVTLWGTGFGPTSPPVPPGETSAQAVGSTVAFVSMPPAITIGGVVATVVAAALNPGALGLYQIAVTIPAAAPSGDQTIVATAGGKSSPATGVLFSVQ